MKLFMACIIAMLLLIIYCYADFTNDEYKRGFNDGYNKYIESYIPVGLFSDEIPIKKRNRKLLKKAP